MHDWNARVLNDGDVLGARQTRAHDVGHEREQIAMLIAGQRRRRTPRRRLAVGQRAEQLKKLAILTVQVHHVRQIMEFWIVACIIYIIHQLTYSNCTVRVYSRGNRKC